MQLAGKEKLQVRLQARHRTSRIERSTPCPDLPMQLYHKRNGLSQNFVNMMMMMKDNFGMKKKRKEMNEKRMNFQNENVHREWKEASFPALDNKKRRSF